MELLNSSSNSFPDLFPVLAFNTTHVTSNLLRRLASEKNVRGVGKCRQIAVGRLRVHTGAGAFSHHLGRI